MITKDQLAEGYALNLRLIERQTASLSHADSLIQTPYNINCLNWVLGHMAVGRDSVHRLVGEEPLLSEGETNRYKTDSDPIIEDGEHVIQLERLLEILTTGQKRITSGFLGLPRKSCHRRFRWGAPGAAWSAFAWILFSRHISHKPNRSAAANRWYQRQNYLAREANHIISEPEVLQFLYHFDPIRSELVTNPYAWTKEDMRIGQAHFAYLKQATQDGFVLLSGRSLDGFW